MSSFDNPIFWTYNEIKQYKKGVKSWEIRIQKKHQRNPERAKEEHKLLHLQAPLRNQKNSKT